MGQNTGLLRFKLVTIQAKLQKGENHNNKAQVSCVCKIQGSGFSLSMLQPSYSIRGCRKRKGNRTLFRVQGMGVGGQAINAETIG
jgi:hypothetical protein